jgi:hypothetical protein
LTWYNSVDLAGPNATGTIGKNVVWLKKIQDEFFFLILRWQHIISNGSTWVTLSNKLNFEGLN